jgi:hypothetical protein
MFAAAAPSSLSRALQLISGVLRSPRQWKWCRVKPSGLAVMVVSVLTAVIVGTTICTAILLLSGPEKPSLELLVVTIGIASLATAPLALTLGLTGGVVVQHVLGRTPGYRSVSWWLGKGAAIGALMGAVGAAIYTTAFAPARLDVLMLYLVPAILAGVVCGATMGAWCALQRRPSSQERAAAHAP